MTPIWASLLSIFASFIGSLLASAFNAGKFTQMVKDLGRRVQHLEEQHDLDSAHGRAQG